MPGWESDALIVDAVRSPIGKRDGTLASIRGDELSGQVLNALVQRQDLDSAQVEDVQFGCVTQVGEQGWNVGRMVPLVAGWPETVCGTTVARTTSVAFQHKRGSSLHGFCVRSMSLSAAASSHLKWF